MANTDIRNSSAESAHVTLQLAQQDRASGRTEAFPQENFLMLLLAQKQLGISVAPTGHLVVACVETGDPKI